MTGIVDISYIVMISDPYTRTTNTAHTFWYRVIDRTYLLGKKTENSDNYEKRFWVYELALDHLML